MGGVALHPRARLKRATRRCSGVSHWAFCFGNFQDVLPAVACCLICKMGICERHVAAHVWYCQELARMAREMRTPVGYMRASS